jgi:hypothetical protein
MRTTESDAPVRWPPIGIQVRSKEVAPLPEPAEPAIWEGRAARKREALTTDRGWAPSKP